MKLNSKMVADSIKRSRPPLSTIQSDGIGAKTYVFGVESTI
jgi:hypothetical protein